MGLPAPSLAALPRQFGRYLLFDRIGRGGMADIYLAQMKTELGVPRRVVVKAILPELSGDPRFARLLVDEAKLVAGLRHANVVQVLDLGREGDRLFIAMEYVEGLDLNQLLARLSKRKIALPTELALFIVREVLAALDFAHRAQNESGPLGIVHRDVSPSNILISFEGEVKLCDFGIAKAFAKAPSSSAEHEGGGLDSEEESGAHIVGKAAYMAPEHARGEELDPRADIFSAGIVLYELCAGRRLYRGTEEEMLRLARKGEVPPLPERGLPHPEELQAILDRALAFDRDERFATAAEFLRALDDYSLRAKLFASQLRFGAFLSEHFEEEVVRLRRERERAVEALARGPILELAPIAEPDAEPECQAEPESPLEHQVRASDEPGRPKKTIRIAYVAAALVLFALALALALR